MLERGYRKHKIQGAQTKVYAIGSGDIIRYFGPHAIRRSWGCELLGVFGIDLPNLREWLLARGHDRPISGLCYYMTNERQFMRPVAVVDETDLPNLKPWFDAIHSRVLSLPSDVHDLATAMSGAADHLRLLRESSLDFWPGYNEWIRRDKYGNAPR